MTSHLQEICLLCHSQEVETLQEVWDCKDDLIDDDVSSDDTYTLNVDREL